MSKYVVVKTAYEIQPESRERCGVCPFGIGSVDCGVYRTGRERDANGFLRLDACSLAETDNPGTRLLFAMRVKQ